MQIKKHISITALNKIAALLYLNFQRPLIKKAAFKFEPFAAEKNEGWLLNFEQNVNTTIELVIF